MFGAKWAILANIYNWHNSEIRRSNVPKSNESFSLIDLSKDFIKRENRANKALKTIF